MLPSLNPPSAVRSGSIIAGLACIFLLSACACPAWADEPAPGAGDSVSDLAAEVLRKAGGNGNDGLGDWTRSIIDRALERADDAARQTVPGSSESSSAPLPAERHAARTADGLAGRGNTPEILLFTSVVCAGGELAAMGARRGADRGADGAAGRGRRRVAGHGETDRPAARRP